MKIHCIVHTSFEKLGAIQTWAERHGHPLTGTQVYKGEALPQGDTFDLLIVMGGPQSPLEIQKFPYLATEIALIKSAVQQNKKIVGICLGAQLVAAALGAKAEHSTYKEIGVYPIELLAAAQHDPVFSQFPPTFDVMHWHNDMPGIANGAVLLAQSAGCPRQAFRYGDRIYGLQFHLEFTKKIIAGMIAHCPNDLRPDRYVSTKTELLNADFATMNAKMFVLLDYLASLTAK